MNKSEGILRAGRRVMDFRNKTQLQAYIPRFPVHIANVCGKQGGEQ